VEGINQIVSDIKAGNTKPIYFLMGAESYYIDKVSDYIEKNVLTEEEKGFNQMVLYGRDVSIEDIVANAKRFPMMAEKQVIIVKEAQDLSRTIENLVDYAENPQPSTVLVICTLMLVEFLGTDLSKINNELQKLLLISPKNSLITASHVEENIGISKDFNNFELRKAVGAKQILKANQIINYFAQNPRSNPLVMTISLLNSFFTQLLIYHGLKNKNKANVAKALRVNPYFVGDYDTAARNYPMRKVSQIISLLRTADLKSKGVGATNMNQGDILKELLFRMMH